MIEGLGELRCRRHFFILDMPLLDTRQQKNLMGTFIADIVLQLLAFVAENERTNIKVRQAEGIAAAKAKGVQFGRKPIELPSNFMEICNAYINGDFTIRSAARKLSMAPSTFYRKYCEIVAK